MSALSASTTACGVCRSLTRPPCTLQLCHTLRKWLSFRVHIAPFLCWKWGSECLGSFCLKGSLGHASWSVTPQYLVSSSSLVRSYQLGLSVCSKARSHPGLSSSDSHINVLSHSDLGGQKSASVFIEWQCQCSVAVLDRSPCSWHSSVSNSVREFD